MATAPRSRGTTEVPFVDRLRSIRWGLFALLTLTASIGVVMLYSAAGASFSPWAANHGYRFFLAASLLFFVALVDIRIWQRFAYAGYVFGILGLLTVQFFGSEGGGAQRWIDLGFMKLQPSEMMKIALIVALARYFNGKTLEDMGKISTLVVPVLLVLLPTALIFEQPDLGTSAMLAAVGAIIFFCAGVRWWKVLLVATAGAAIVPLAWPFLATYQKNRILTFLNPENDPLGTGYHIIQSKIAFGSGGLFGKGFTQGTQSQLSFLPETQTDFIFALIAEEWGMLGALVILALYIMIIFYCLWVSMRSRSQFGRLLAVGFSANMFFYVFANMGMVTGLLPVVGVPLPLISWGGTVMIATMVSMGFVMNAYIFRKVVLGLHNDG